MSRSCALAAAASAALVSSVLAQTTPPCWNPNLGSDLRLSDDSLAVGLQLGFNFPHPGGAGVTNLVDVSSNGFVWLVSGSSNSTGCCSGSSSALLADPARIAPVWMDLNPSAGGSVHFRSNATEAIVTWLEVPEFPAAGANTVQLQMFPDGRFVIFHRALTDPGTHSLLVGVSAGNGASDPGEIDYSTLPHASGGVPTVYEEFVTGTDVRDTVGQAFYFIPDGSGGYLVAPLSPCAQYRAYGQGCPGSRAMAVYELFDVRGAQEQVDLTNNFSMELVPTASGGFRIQACTQGCWESSLGTNLNLRDDDVSPPLPLGFTTVLGGVITSEIRVSSNGFLYLQGGTSSGCCNGDVQQFLANEPRIAVLWTDLNPFAGGQVTHNTFPGRAVVTWNQVPEYGTGNAETVQAQLFSDGRVVLTYQQATVTSHDVLVGFSGGGAPDPGESDFSAQLPITTSGTATPLTLAPAGSGLPTLGATFELMVAAIPNGSPFGAVLLGFANPNVPLDPAGMPGCTLLAGGEAALTFIPGRSQVATVPLSIPSSTGIAGAVLRSQGFAIAPGANPLGVVASNGGEIIPGF